MSLVITLEAQTLKPITICNERHIPEDGLKIIPIYLRSRKREP